jgi:DNA polymerase-3 subunit epsilon
MNSFATIDFEIANRHHTSVCSVGIVIVHNGEIVEKIYHLIRPEPEYYWRSFTKIHGLTFADTENADIFPTVWAKIAPKIEGLPLVAHNSTFDEGCLRAVHKMYQMDYPDYEFHCTLRASRKVFGKKLPNHRLPTVALHCGFDLANHHHALSDAEACAWVAMRVFL